MPVLLWSELRSIDPGVGLICIGLGLRLYEGMSPQGEWRARRESKSMRERERLQVNQGTTKAVFRETVDPRGFAITDFQVGGI